MKNLMKAPLGAMVALVLVTPAMAQDVAGERNWTGPYVGGSIGLGWPDDKSDETLVFDTNGDGEFDDVVTSGGTDIFTGYCDGRARSGAAADGCVNDRTGTDWAVHAGYDMQFGTLVAGLVLEGGVADISDNVTGFTNEPGHYTLRARLKENAALRARVGYTAGNTLFYVTGGGAYGNIKHRLRTSNTANAFTGNSENDAWGWTAGAGIEHLVSDNFSVGLLYKYTSLDPKDFEVTVTEGTASPTGPFTDPATTSGQTVIARSSDKFKYHSARVTASFRF